LSNESADPQNLAGAYVEGYVSHPAAGKTHDAYGSATSGGRRPTRKEVAWVAPDHQADEACGVDSGRTPVGGHGAVLQHRKMIAEPDDLVEAVRYVEHHHAFVAQSC
jgi:hypothetical protein